ncbi:hypothetical protein GP486_007232 [Trichoglossum hirsutum]|uniref:TFIIS N-terminal domain-containing protein n=1 Tax=Trichoglossum hirsutum TaxID=265104 RepID=A0A9P8ID45_9PEZI|nr:hypothetical protein GP486_007232 [Trichoglossum hirsutum]
MPSALKPTRRISAGPAAASVDVGSSSRKRPHQASPDNSGGSGDDSGSDSSDGGYTLALRSIRRQIESLKRDEEARYLGTMTHLDALNDAVTHVTNHRNREKRRRKKKRRREGTTGRAEGLVETHVTVVAQNAHGTGDDSIKGNEIAAAIDTPSGQALEGLAADSTPTWPPSGQQKPEPSHQHDGSLFGETRDETASVPRDGHANAETTLDETYPIDGQGLTKARSEACGAPQASREEKTTDSFSFRQKRNLIYFIRYRVQKALLPSKGHPANEPDEAVLAEVAEHFAKLEGLVHIDEEIFQQSKIYKVMRGIDKLPSVPGDDKYHFKRRARDLLLRWKKPLATKPRTALTGSGITDGPPPSREWPCSNHAQSMPGAADTSHTISLPRGTMSSQPPQPQEANLLQTNARHQEPVWNSEVTEKKANRLLPEPELINSISGNLNKILHEESIDPSPRDTEESGDDVPARDAHPVIASTATGYPKEDERKLQRLLAEAAKGMGFKEAASYLNTILSEHVHNPTAHSEIDRLLVGYKNRDSELDLLIDKCPSSLNVPPEAIRATLVTQPSSGITVDPLLNPQTPIPAKLSHPRSAAQAATVAERTDGIPRMAMSRKARGKQRMTTDEDPFPNVRGGSPNDDNAGGSTRHSSPDQGAILEGARRRLIEADEALAISLTMAWEDSQIQERHDEVLARRLQEKYNDCTYDSEQSMEGISFHAPDPNDRPRLKEDCNQSQRSNAQEVRRVVSQDTEMKDIRSVVKNGQTEHTRDGGSHGRLLRRENANMSGGWGWPSMGVQKNSHTATTLPEVHNCLTTLRGWNTGRKEQPHSRSDKIEMARTFTGESDDSVQITHIRPAQTIAMDWDSPPHERRKVNSLSNPPPRPRNMFSPAYKTVKPAVVTAQQLMALRTPYDNRRNDFSRNISKSDTTPRGYSSRTRCSLGHGEGNDKDEDEPIQVGRPKSEQRDGSPSSRTASPTP